MVRNRISIFLILIIFSFSLAQRIDDIQSRKKELEKIRNEIQQLDKKLKETQKAEKKNLDVIDVYDKQLRLIRSLLNQLSEEEKRLNDEIKLREMDLKTAEQEFKSLQSEYEQHVVNLYKYGRRNPLELLLSSESVNQALLRYKYFQKFSAERKRRLDLIKTKALEVEKEKQNLLQILNQKELLRIEKSKDESALKGKISEKRNLVNSLRKNKEALLKDLKRKKQSEKQITNLIERLIEQKRKEELLAKQRALEKQKKLQQEKALRKNKTKQQPKDSFDKTMTKTKNREDLFNTLPKFSSFSKMKGNLPWPVNGRIVNRFGEQKNPALNTVTLNFGVDIAAPFGSPVKAIADGVVSIVHWLPGYGNIIILTHSEDYRTVYAYLSDVLVTEGQLVKRGDVIALSGESLSGEMLHLEIWKEREKQNPELWLARR